MDPAQVTARSQLRGSLKGKTLLIPDLQSYLQHWPQEVSPHVNRLREDVNKRLELLLPQGERLRIAKETDIGLFGASWWPYASFEALRIATYLSIWLFVWDDEIDSPEFSTMVSDFDKAERFRKQTIDYIRKSLTSYQDVLNAETSSSIIVTSFLPIAQAIAGSCTHSQIDLFFDEIVRFVNMTSIEQEYQLSNNFPSLEEYQERRGGTSAVGVCLAITEYCFGMEVPAPIMRSDLMKNLWDHTNVIISTTNDILSIRKELANGQVDTLIPLLYHSHGTIEAAMDIAVGILRTSIESFDRSAQQLLDLLSYDAETYCKFEKFINGCKYACTANLNWSLCSGRYKLKCQSTKGGIRVML